MVVVLNFIDVVKVVDILIDVEQFLVQLKCLVFFVSVRICEGLNVL